MQSVELINSLLLSIWDQTVSLLEGTVKQTALMQKCTVSCQSYDQGGAEAQADSEEKTHTPLFLQPE